VFWIYLKTGLLIGAFLLGSTILLFLLWSAVEQPERIVNGTGSLPAVLLLALVFLVIVLGLGVLKRLFLDRGLWQAIVNSTTVFKLATLDSVAASGAPAGSLGEGLADALDVSGGF
jgi:hypothetical protein